MVRLLQSGLIKPEDLARKYANELFATEIMLLAYYVSAVNIETTYNALREEEALRNGQEPPEYQPFMGIALADTFQIHEDGDIPDLEIFADNNATIERQKEAPINVIVGNPPYSAGQSSANDLNANLKYPSLDTRIAETYAANSTSTNKNSLYDSYLRAFRWATDRIGHQGVVAFVTNNGWIDGNTGAGVRLSMAEDFTDVYVINLRGNSRTSGETAKKEGGNVFDIRVGVSVFVGVKDPARSQFTIHYYSAGDYETKGDKLAFANTARLESLPWSHIAPNDAGDWINQRSEEFSGWLAIGEKKSDSATFFKTFSRGVETGRDAWVYSSSRETLKEYVQETLNFFNSAICQINPKEKPKDFLKRNPQFADKEKSVGLQPWNNVCQSKKSWSLKKIRSYSLHIALSQR